MSERIHKIAALAGDGIGPEVMGETLKVLRAAADALEPLPEHSVLCARPASV